MSRKILRRWLAPVTVAAVLGGMIVVSVRLEMYYDEQPLPPVIASQNYLQALETRKDIAKTINVVTIALFLLAVAPLLRRKEADITLDFSDRPLVWTLLCVVLGAAGSFYWYVEYLSGIVENQMLGGSHPGITKSAAETVPDLFAPPVSFRFNLQIGFLIYATIIYIVCLVWARPWERRAGVGSEVPSAPAESERGCAGGTNGRHKEKRGRRKKR